MNLTKGIRYILVVCITLICVSCKKDRKSCYECDIAATPVGNYTGIGCYTTDEWQASIQTDVTGMAINKNTRCRVK